MTGRRDDTSHAGGVEFQALLRLVRQIDPAADAATIQQYGAEIRDAELELAQSATDDQDLPVGFSAQWPGREKR